MFNQIMLMQNQINMSSQPGSNWDNYSISEDYQGNFSSYERLDRKIPAHRKRLLAL